jgi:hypothetical protein
VNRILLIRNQRESRRDCCRLYDQLLSRTDRSTGNPGISDNARSVLAHLLLCFSDTIKGAFRQFYFVVLLPDGTVVDSPRMGSHSSPFRCAPLMKKSRVIPVIV